MSLRAAILGFLDIEPSSGYSLRQRFEGSVGSFWTVTQSQIYRELHALEKDRLVAAKVTRGNGKPDRRTYALTDTGREALRTWLNEPLQPMQLRHPLLLKLVFAGALEAPELDALLDQYQRDMETTRAEYAARLASADIFDLARSSREAAIWRLSIEHGVGWCDAEIAWLRRARLELSESRSRRARPHSSNTSRSSNASKPSNAKKEHKHK
jgi:PadR family transcriptional regulator, regulatory protein AphA